MEVSRIAWNKIEQIRFDWAKITIKIKITLLHNNNT